MNRLLCSLVISASVSLALAAPGEPAGRNFSVADIRGSFGFAWDGFVGALPAAAIGRLSSDGQGNITDGVRTLVVAGTVVPQTFTCSYSVDPEGTGSATCTVLTGGTPSTEKFDFVIVDKRDEAFFTATSGGATIRGVIRRQ